MNEIYVDRTTEYFGRIPDWLNGSDVSDAGYRLYGHLATRYAGYKKGIFPSQETLAKELNKTTRSIRNAITELVRVGALRVSQRGLNKTNVYDLAYDHCFNDEYAKVLLTKEEVELLLTIDNLSDYLIEKLTALLGELSE